MTKLHAERDYYEESMKKAFMRGVCALNMEAMAMFHDGEGKSVEEGEENYKECAVFLVSMIMVVLSSLNGGLRTCIYFYMNCVFIDIASSLYEHQRDNINKQ